MTQTVNNYCANVTLPSNNPSSISVSQEIYQLILAAFQEKDVEISEIQAEVRKKIQVFTNPKDQERIFDQAANTILCKIQSLPDDLFKTYTLNSIQLLLTQLREDLFIDKSLEKKVAQGVYAQRSGINTGDPLNQVEVDYWKRFKYFQLDTGIFSTGSQYVTPYARILNEPLHLSSNSSLLVGTVSLGAFTAFSQEGPFDKERITVGAIPSGSLLAGTSLDLTDNLSVRAAVESAMSLYGGVFNTSTNYWFDNDVGAGLAYEASDKTKVASGAIVHTTLAPANVQEGVSPIPRYTHTSPYLTFENPILNIDLEAPIYRNELEGSIKLWKNFSIRDGILQASVDASGTIAGDIAANPFSLFASVAYFWGDNDEGVSGAVRLNAAGNKDNTPKLHPSFRDVGGLGWSGNLDKQGMVIDLKEQILRKETTTVSCKSGDSWGEQICSVRDDQKPIGALYCSQDGNEYDCIEGNYADAQSPALIGLTRFRFAEDGKHIEVIKQDARAQNEFFGVLYHEDTVEGFGAGLRNAPEYEKIAYLEYMIEQLYELYDSAGLAIFNGSGDVNTIGKNEAYRTFREYAIYHKKNRKTVCRGIAPLVATAAHYMGLDSYTAVIQTRTVPHVVVLVKPKGGEWNVISHGRESFQSADQSISKTLDDYALAANLPPQPFYQLFDHNGDYIRRVETNFGNTLLNKTTPAKELDSFLKKTNF